MQNKSKHKYKIDLKPTQILVLGFLSLIIIGAILLNLPIASANHQSIGFVDALFTATSAVCVTGLVVVNTLHYWSIFGKVVIIILIQIGGLGVMTFATMFFIIMGRKIRLKERLIIQEALNQYTISGMVRLTRNVLLGTLLIEGIGAVLLSIRFVPEYGPSGIFKAIFHSISAFCNAGFDIKGSSSLSPYIGDIIINFTIMILIILGGLGFTVWLDIIRVLKEKFNNKYTWKRAFRKFTLHTKIVLVMTFVLILIGFVFFFILETTNPNTLGNLSIKDKILGSLFQSVTTRTAGFNTMPLSEMTHASKFMTIILMFIGGSPAGTAGGVKTVTMGVIIVTVISGIRGKESTEVYGRTIPQSIVKRAIAVISIGFSVVITVTMILTVTEAGSFMDILFESVSAFATVGLTLGITSSLTTIGKIVICITMFIGRLGPLTMAVALSMKGRSKVNIKKPEEKVMVG
ncbi:MAG: TrkH family potassium uptake protein [Vallitalea sp.]|jgi:trk system potassium uptake protein TrkH|nr:TrkH family potassium uptake protein [Vallitalea sp.]